MRNTYFKQIGDSKFFFEVPYDIDFIPPEIDYVDNSYLACVTNPGDRRCKKTVSFWLDDDGRLHFHSYPDKDTECYNPWVKFNSNDVNKDYAISWVIDFLSKHVISVNESFLNKKRVYWERQMKKAQSVIDEIDKIKTVKI